MLPPYLAKAVPNPPSNRAPWYKNTAPTYAGVFLWVAFYMSLAGIVIDKASIGLTLAALAVAGLLSYALYYYAPAMLGMKTGYPLYVVGSSTFGTAGGYLMPGLLMGLLQIGWFAVGTFFATKFILTGIGMDATPGTAIFTVVAVIWGYTHGLDRRRGYSVRRARVALSEWHIVPDGSGGVHADLGRVVELRGRSGEGSRLQCIHAAHPGRDRLLCDGRRGGYGFRHEQPQ